MICRTQFADDIKTAYQKTHGGNAVKWLLIIVITTLFTIFSFGFYCMSESMSIIYPILFSSALLASCICYTNCVVNADNQFKAFILTRDEVIMVNCARAFLDFRSFDSNIINNPFEKEYIKRIKARKYLDQMNTSGKYEEYITSPYVMQHHGYFVQKVVNIRHGRKCITVYARLRATSYPPDAKIIFDPVRRIKIPADFTNIDQLNERLESLMNN